MANIQNTVSALENLNIRDIAEDWVKTIWDNDFSDCDALPLDLSDTLNDVCLGQHLQALKKTLQPWARGQEASTGEGFWTLLAENSLPHRSLVTLLYYIMDVGEKRVATAKQKEAGILAANVYLTLIMTPGSGAFRLFHPVLFQKTTDMFKPWGQMGTPKRKRQSSPIRNSQRSQKSRGSKRARNSNPEEEEEDEAEEDEDEDRVYTPSELLALGKAFFNLLKALVELLSSYSLKDAEDSSMQCLQTLVELSKLEPETFSTLDFDDTVPVDRLRTVPEVAYRGLMFLCGSSHGDSATMLKNVLKHLLPSLLMFIGEKGIAATTIPRQIQDIKDQAVAFVCHIIKQKQGELGVLTAMRTLVQHLCTKVPDKTEYRTRVAQSVYFMLCEFPAKEYASMMEWLFKYSKNEKTSFRFFALDLACMLLDKPERREAVAPEKAVFLTHKFLVQLLLSRCSDSAPTVRARAILGFGQCFDALEPSVTGAVKDILTPYQGPTNARTRLVPSPHVGRVIPKAGQLQADPRGPQGHPSPDLSIPAAADHSRGEEQHTMEQPAQDQEGVTPVAGMPDDADMVTPAAIEHFTRGGSPFVTIMLTPGVQITLADGMGVSRMLRRRAADEKVNVRKSAVSALESLVRLEGEDLSQENLNVINERCRDPALSVRKQALASLNQLLLDMGHNKHVQSAWLDGVMPMVVDREQTAQDRCLEMVEHTLLSSLVPHGSSSADSSVVTWQLLTIMASPAGMEPRTFFSKACQLWGRTGKLRPGLVKVIRTHVAKENNQATWMLLAELARFAPKFDTSFIVDYWHSYAKSAPESEYSTVHRVLVVLGHIAKTLSSSDLSDISADLKQSLMKFNLPPELVSVTATTLNKICMAASKGEESTRVMKDWFVELVKACDVYLSRIILDEAGAAVNEDEVIRHLFTLGEIAQLCPDKTPKRAFMLVQSLVAAPVITSIDGSSQQPSQGWPSHSQPSSQLSSQPPSSRTSVAGTSQPAGMTDLAHTQLSQWATQADALSQFRGSRMSSKVRAHAFLTLGKFCLQHEDIAKKVVPAMARELEISPHAAIRNNVVIVMCDLCVRYTGLVDRYIAKIAACLKDDSALIRKQTLTLLTRLLQEDFLKWKGSLFFRFIVTIVDDNEDIRNFAEFCLIHLLIQRHPGMFFNHFIECIFHFNAFENHKAYNKFPQNDREKRMFNLKGQQNAEKREKMYKLMLENMTDEHKFQLTAKLCSEVLAPIVDGLVQFDQDTAAVLRDTLMVLASKEIKLSSLKSRAVEDPDTVQDAAQAVMAQAKKTLISQVVKRNTVENIVPTVISLKHMLEQHRSSVLKELMLYLREIMKDYKNEVKDILTADRQLANEIEFDLRKFDEQQQEQAEQENQAERARKHAQEQQTNHGGKSPARSPGGAGPARAVTPPLPAPVLALRSPRGAGPNTPTRLSTLAIMNSARKAVEQAKRLAAARQNSPAGAAAAVASGEAIKSPDSSTASSKAPGKKHVLFSESTSEGEMTDITGNSSTGSEVFKTPKQTRGAEGKTPNKLRRAISTPHGNLSMLGNITFQQGEQDMSLIPMSPIPSHLPIRLYDNNSKSSSRQRSWSTKIEKDDAGKLVQKDVVHMLSPNQPTPKPRTWNVQSPLPSKPQLDELESDDEEEDNEENTSPEIKATKSSNKPPAKTKKQGKRSVSAAAARRTSGRTRGEPAKSDTLDVSGNTRSRSRSGQGRKGRR